MTKLLKTNWYTMVKLKHYALIFFILLCKSVSCYGQEHRSIKALTFPTFGFEPETDWHFGAVSLFTLDFYEDTTTRKSNAKLEFNYTLNQQLIFESRWEYFFREERYKFIGDFHLSRYPDFYYGIGNDTGNDAFRFRSNRIVFDGQLLKNLGDNLFLGLGIGYNRYTHISAFEGGSIPFTELKDANNFSFGTYLSWDHRNNLLNTSSGYLVNIGLDYSFSAVNYWNINLDTRKYFSLGKNVFAINLLAEFLTNTPPFYDYRYIGGSNKVRGYFKGRYRDRNLATLQVEYRTPQWKRIGIVVFGGSSFIFPHLNDLDLNGHLPNVGTGIRFLIDRKENINLRLDYGVGIDGNSGFYIAFGESF